MLGLKQTMVSKPFPLSLGWWRLAVPFYDERVSTEQLAKWLTAAGSIFPHREEIGVYEPPYLRRPLAVQTPVIPRIGLADQKSTALSPRYPGTQFYG